MALSLVWASGLSRASRSALGSGQSQVGGALKLNLDVSKTESVFLVQELIELDHEKSSATFPIRYAFHVLNE